MIEYLIMWCSERRLYHLSKYRALKRSIDFLSDGAKQRKTKSDALREASLRRILLKYLESNKYDIAKDYPLVGCGMQSCTFRKDEVTVIHIRLDEGGGFGQGIGLITYDKAVKLQITPKNTQVTILEEDDETFEVTEKEYLFPLDLPDLSDDTQKQIIHVTPTQKKQIIK